MFSRANLLVVLVAIVGAALGLLAGTRFGEPPEIAPPPGVTVLKPGDLRTDLDLPGTDGRTHRLSEWDGKLVLINFWATWCGPCRDEMPLLDHVRAEHAKDGLEIVGVAIDNPEAVADYLKDSPVHYPILLGGEDEPNPSLLYGDTRSVLPYSVLVGRDGKVLAQRAGSFSSPNLSRWLKPYL
ncbi:MAG TPA: TlpA disulfide reductase family protein [Rudaea sp.]|nr:TlpA disulfide reductase family protein [Rudaea sp.]